MRIHPEFYYRQSAVIPYRFGGDGLEVVLVTSSNGHRWVIPKGVIEPGMTSEASACKEALEEAGLEGRITGPRLGIYEYEKWGGTCTVEVFAMLVERIHDAWEEDHRDRRWFAPHKAARRVREPDLKRMLTDLATAVPPPT